MIFKHSYPSMDLLEIFCVFSFLSLSHLALGSELRVGVSHDLSQPTYGLQGPTSSQVSLDEHHGLNMQGTINDVLGPPVKIANGFSNMFQGSNMASIGSSLRNNGAVVGFDSKLLEALGGASLLKGGLLMGGANAKTGAATVMKGLPGKKIASIIEMPVKVVAMKDIAAGNALTSLGQAKSAQAQESNQRGEEMQKKGDALKQQGFQQVVQGASEGVTNLGNMGQHIASNTASAIRLLPIMMDLQNEQYRQQHPVQTQQHEATQTQTKQRQSVGQQVTGGSLFGGINSLLPENPFSQGTVAGSNTSPFGNLFAGLSAGHNNFGNQHFAAVLNASNPLTSLLMNNRLNPFLMPITAGGGYGQQATKTSSTGSGSGSNSFGSSSLGSGLFGLTSQIDPSGQSATYNYNVFPFRVREHTESQLPTFSAFSQHHVQQHPFQQSEKTRPVEQTSQQTVEAVVQTPVQQQVKAEHPVEQVSNQVPLQKAENPK